MHTRAVDLHLLPRPKTLRKDRESVSILKMYGNRAEFEDNVQINFHVRGRLFVLCPLAGTRCRDVRGHSCCPFALQGKVIDQKSLETTKPLQGRPERLNKALAYHEKRLKAVYQAGRTGWFTWGSCHPAVWPRRGQLCLKNTRSLHPPFWS